MESLIKTLVDADFGMGWPMTFLVLGILCLASLRRAIDRANSVKFRHGEIEIYLDPQGIHETDDQAKQLAAAASHNARS